MTKFLSVMVVGNNPEELMNKYKIGTKVDKYIKYKYCDADKLKENHISMLKKIIEKNDDLNLSDYQIDSIKENIKTISEMTSLDYYNEITYGLSYDKDGNAYSDVNPNGMWSEYRIGNDYIQPLILKDGKTTYQSTVENIDWGKMHMFKDNINLYEKTWDIVINKKELLDDTDKIIYENMHNHIDYLLSFKTKEQYVKFNCSYWTYAFLDKNGWVDLDCNKNQFDWITQFYDTYIKPLDKKELITIYEYCVKNE